MQDGDQHDIESQSKAFVWTKDHFIDVITGGKKPLVTDPRLIEAFKKINRADFLPQSKANEAYTDREDDFGFGENIASPYLQAQLLQLIDLKEGQKVLDLGTGAGFAMSVISYVIGQGGELYSLERSQSITEYARQNLMKYPELQNFEIVFKDGTDGLISRAPYDRIYVSYAYNETPEPLIMQLKVGGKLVIPYKNAEIKLIERVTEEDYSEELVAVKATSGIKYGIE